MSWNAPPNSGSGVINEGGNSSTPQVDAFLAVATVDQASSLPSSTPPENPLPPPPSQLLANLQPMVIGEDADMAYQRADPALFIPPLMHRINVPGRVPMVPAVARARPPKRNETVAIVNINPLLEGIVLHYPTVRQILEEFLKRDTLGLSRFSQVIQVKPLLFSTLPMNVMLW